MQALRGTAREGRQKLKHPFFLFSWNKGNGRKENMKKKGGKKVLARRMWKSQRFPGPAMGAWSLFLSYAECIWSIPRANSAITSDSHRASELSARGSGSHRALCRLASQLLHFPVGHGSSWRPGQAHLSEASCKLPLGLPAAAPSSPWLSNIHSPKPSPCLGAC